ncbi:MAG: TetR/AcrR family transcriptional regulator [Bacteroidota bacterium]
MGIVERKERQRKEVRDSILEAAWRLVNEEGWQSLSIRKIADAIEYSVPVVYDHFENKEAILFEFNKLGFKLLGEKIKETKEKYSTSAEQLEAIAYTYWDFAFKNQEYYQVMFGLGMPGCDQVKKMPEILNFTQTIEAIIKEIVDANSNTEANTHLKLNTFWSMLHGLVSINLMTSESKEEFNKMILKDFISVFIKGLEK